MALFPDISSGENLPKLSLSNPSEEILPVKDSELEELLLLIEQGEKVTFREVELVYVGEKYITDVNKEYLNRDYVTDIISFRYDEDEANKAIEGTLFCCAPRIREQSIEQGTAELHEFFRIFIHGLLHLAGYDDQTENDKKTMTRLENKYLKLLGIES